MAYIFGNPTVWCITILLFGICRASNLTCPGFAEDSGMFKKTYHWPNTTAIPAEKRSYMCMVVELPKDKDYHMVAVDPYIDNTDAVGFLIFYGCMDNALDAHTLDTPYTCFMHGSCATVLSTWKVGTQPGHCMHRDTGFRVGIASGAFKYAKIEMVWLNPSKATGLTDGSGVTLYVTPNRRKYDAGVLLIGQTDVSLPPGEKDYTLRGTCKGMCTQKQVKGSVTIVSALNHMHYRGAKGETLMTPGTSVQYLAIDKHYNYDKPTMHIVNDSVMMPGYELQVTCHYDTTPYTTRTNFGFSTAHDEMCFAYITYYPKENITESTCLSHSDIGACEWKEALVRGCNVTEFRNTASGKGKELYNMVMDNCDMDSCLYSCKNVIKTLSKSHCFSNPLRTYFVREKKNMEFWMRFASCDAWHNEIKCTTSAVAMLNISWSSLLIGLLIITSTVTWLK